MDRIEREPGDDEFVFLLSKKRPVNQNDDGEEKNRGPIEIARVTDDDSIDFARVVPAAKHENASLAM